MIIPKVASSETLAAKMIVRGVHLELTDAIRAYVASKTSRLLRRNRHIVRVRIDVERDRTRTATRQFASHGHIEIGGPDLVANVAADNLYKAIDLLVDKLDGLLRRRHGLRKDRRHHPRGVALATVRAGTT